MLSTTLPLPLSVMVSLLQMDSRVVSRSIKNEIWPLLRKSGFSAFSARTAWRFAPEQTHVVNFQSFNTYLAERLGCTTVSFGLNLGIYLPHTCVPPQVGRRRIDITPPGISVSLSPSPIKAGRSISVLASGYLVCPTRWHESSRGDDGCGRRNRAGSAAMVRRVWINRGSAAALVGGRGPEVVSRYEKIASPEGLHRAFSSAAWTQGARRADDRRGTSRA